MLPLAAGLAVFLLLQGCIGVDTTVRFAADGSGTVQMSYRVSQMVTRLGTGEGENGGVPLPITSEDFRQAVADAPGVTLNGDVRRTEDEDDIHIEATLRFDRVESLAALRGFGSMEPTLTREGPGWKYRQVVAEGSGGADPIDEDTLAMVRSLFADYALTFVIEAPSAIRSSTLGAVSGSTVTYRVSIVDLLQAKDAVILEVTW